MTITASISLSRDRDWPPNSADGESGGPDQSGVLVSVVCSGARKKLDAARISASLIFGSSDRRTGNDYGFERTFERQVRGLGQPDDVFIAISTSGRSANVIAALKAAREGGLTTIGFTGSGGADVMQSLCDHCFAAPTEETPLIQQIHIVAAHAICGLVERSLFPQRK